MKQYLKPRIVDDPHEIEEHTIPIPLIMELFTFCPYASIHSVVVKMLHFTGCRYREIDRMKRDMILGNWIYWSIGKNQKGYRKEYLPQEYIDELKEYWNKNKVPLNSVFGVNAETYRRYFWRDIRPYLSDKWRSKRTVLRNREIGEEYYYQLRGFRKNFATMWFNYFLVKYNDAGLSAEMVSKKMKHSLRGMTVKHYIEEIENLEINKHKGLLPFDIKEKCQQNRILDYMDAVTSI